MAKNIKQNIKQKEKRLLGKRHKVVNERHRRLLKRISDNLGNGMSLGETMRLEGYSKSYSESPSQLLSTKNWQELTQEILPDESLVKVHKGLLNHKNWRARADGLDKAYKIKKKYGPIEISHRIKRPLEEVEDEIAEALSEINELVRGKK